MVRLILYWFIQICGAFAGVLIVYLIFADPIEGYLLWPLVQNPDIAVRFISEEGGIFYAKVCWLEFINTFMFCLVYLILIYKPSLRLVDELIKGIAIGFTLWISYELDAGAGACLNPAFAIAQVSYQVGFLRTDHYNGGRYASLIWVYIVFPLLGGIVAALFFRFHIHQDNKALEESAK